MDFEPAQKACSASSSSFLLLLFALSFSRFRVEISFRTFYLKRISILSSRPNKMLSLSFSSTTQQNAIPGETIAREKRDDSSFTLLFSHPSSPARARASSCVSHATKEQRDSRNARDDEHVTVVVVVVCRRDIPNLPTVLFKKRNLAPRHQRWFRLNDDEKGPMKKRNFDILRRRTTLPVLSAD